MKRVLLLNAFLLVGVAAPQVGLAQTSPVQLVEQAVAAVGGAEALRGLKRLAITADGRHWEPEQSFVAGGEPRLLGVSTLTISWDIENGMARTDWNRAMHYPFAVPEKYSEIVTPRFGYVATAKSDRPMSAIRIAAHSRELERASPTLLLKALDSPQSLGALPDQPLDAQTLPAIVFNDGGTKFIILFDRKTHLPAAIRTLDDDSIRGDSNYDLVLADWRPVAGVQVAHTLTYKLGGVDVGRMTYKEVVANPSIASQTFEARDELRKDGKSPATGNVPYQWVLRRLNLARFTDSDAINYDATSSHGLKLVEVTPAIQHVAGGTHNSLIVAMQDYLVVFDAPINEWQSRWTIDAAKARYPGKPVKYLVLTHHHNDHTGGARTYVAEGATVIVGSPNKAHFERIFRTPHTTNPDELQKSPKPATLVEVADQMSLKDGNHEIRLYKIANPHAEGMLIGYVVGEGVVWVTDLYSPVRDKTKGPWVAAFHEAIRKLGIAPTRYAGGHGGVAPSAELEAVMSQN